MSEGGRGNPAPAGTSGYSPAAPTRRGPSFATRMKRIGIALLALPFVVLALAEGLHQLQRGHLFMPLTLHWDLDTREVDVRGNKLREVRPRLTNFTLLPLKIERLEGEGMLWFREMRYRHLVEHRAGASSPWRVLHREDLVYERQGRPPSLSTLVPGATIVVAWHPVQDAGTPGGAAVLHRGEQVRFVLYARLDGDERSPDQRVYRSPPFTL